MGVEEYRVKVYTPTFKYVSHPMTMLEALKYIAQNLKVLRALDCLDRGIIEPTSCIFTGDTIYHKTYVIEVAVPYTKFVLKKQSKGSFDLLEFQITLKYVKGLYDERI
jgi:hypothetical protein